MKVYVLLRTDSYDRGDPRPRHRGPLHHLPRREGEGVVSVHDFTTCDCPECHASLLELQDELDELERICGTKEGVVVTEKARDILEQALRDKGTNNNGGTE